MAGQERRPVFTGHFARYYQPVGLPRQRRPVQVTLKREGRANDGGHVDLASVDTGAAEGDEEVAGKPWFNTKDFPTAKFISTSVKALGGNRYEVAGQLTIKGKTQPVVAPTTVTVQGDQATFDGSFVIKRADFAIGEGDWADFSVVANEIQVKFKVLASGGK